VEAALKMGYFNVPRASVPRGSAEEAMVLSMSEDIPGDLNDDLLMEQLQAYLRRAQASVARERLLVPQRVVQARWEAYLERLLSPEATERMLNEAGAHFDAAVAMSRSNLEGIHDEKGWEGRLDPAMFLESGAILEALSELAGEWREGRGKGGKREAFQAREKEIGCRSYALDKVLRLIPKE